MRKEIVLTVSDEETNGSRLSTVDRTVAHVRFLVAHNPHQNPLPQKMSSSMQHQLTKHEMLVRNQRLREFVRMYHKRFALFTFNPILSDVKFFDETFDNRQAFLEATGTSIAQVVHLAEDGFVSRDASSDTRHLFFNGHLLCDLQTPWSPRVADDLVRMMEKVRMPDGTPPLLVNPRDFPLARSTHVPWTFLDALLPFQFFKVPMQRPLSFYGGHGWKDVLIPLPEHWNAWDECTRLRHVKRDFSKPTGVFRGTLTGRFTDERNIRIQLARLSNLHPKLLDAGLSAWTNRIRVADFAEVSGELIVEDPPKPKQELLRPPLTQEEQCEYPVLVYAPGHVGASRLGWHMCSGSAVLMVDDPSCRAPDMWFMTSDFHARTVRFVNQDFVDKKDGGIVFSCRLEDVGPALDVLRQTPDLVRRVSKKCTEWAEKMFHPHHQRKVLQEACESSVSV